MNMRLRLRLHPASGFAFHPKFEGRSMKVRATLGECWRGRRGRRVRVYTPEEGTE